MQSAMPSVVRGDLAGPGLSDEAGFWDPRGVAKFHECAFWQAPAMLGGLMGLGWLVTGHGVVESALLVFPATWLARRLFK